MRLLISRCIEDEATESVFGRLWRLSPSGLFEAIGWSAEREWNGNRAGESCVPAGTYGLVRHDGARYKRTLALTGQTVSQGAVPGVPRSACVLHRAVIGRQLQGCVSLGSALYVSERLSLGGLELGDALIREMYEDEAIDVLTIEWAKGPADG